MAQSDSCKSKQTFCDLGQQLVANSPLAFTYSPSSFQDTQITPIIWNQIINKIIEIYNYGERGTRNPGNPLGISNFQAVADNHSGNEDANSAIVSDDSRNSKYQYSPNQINLAQYNEILSTVGLATLGYSNDLKITEEKFNSIKNAINNLYLNADRCNNCNVKCNSIKKKKNRYFIINNKVSIFFLKIISLVNTIIYRI